MTPVPREEFLNCTWGNSAEHKQVRSLCVLDSPALDCEDDLTSYFKLLSLHWIIRKRSLSQGLSILSKPITYLWGYYLDYIKVGRLTKCGWYLSLIKGSQTVKQWRNELRISMQVFIVLLSHFDSQLLISCLPYHDGLHPESVGKNKSSIP